MKTAERNIGLDIVRFTAIILVPVLHSFAYIPMLDSDFLGSKWCFFLALHYLSLICVPLFMMLSGSLMRQKTLSGKYYAGLLKIIVPYVIISLVAIAAVHIKTGVFPGVLEGVKSIFDFTAIGYAWYVEMYIGLYLLIPFLNLLYGALDKKGKQILIVTLASLTVLPLFFKSLSGASHFLDIIPDWWTGIYPITYYFLGAYLGEYKPKIRKRFVLLGLMLSILLPTAVNCFYTAKNGGYAWYVMNGSDCLSTMAIAIFVWLLLADIKKLPRAVSFVVTEISVCSFEMYLYSYIADGFLYSVVSPHISNLHIPPFPVMPLLVILVSYIAARATRFVSAPLSKLLIRTASERKQK